MAAEQRRLLEQLMGETLMNPTARSEPKLPITSSQVCRSYLAGTCPHDLFTNTKNDIGACPRQHSEALKAEYDGASAEQKRKWGFEYDYLRDLQKYIDSCNRKIDEAQRRLEKTDEEVRKTHELLKDISALDASVTTGLEELDALCAQGAVNIAVGEHFKLRQTQLAKAERERELKTLSDTGGPSGHQKLQVCDVCGAYLSRLDNDRRLADHFYGKMHLGYAQMRKTVVELGASLKNAPPPARTPGEEYAMTPLREGGEDMANGAGGGGGWDGGRGGRGGGRQGGWGRGGGGGGGGGYGGGRGGGRRGRY